MRLKALSLALASSCLFYSGADAAGLGKLTVLSALGQPLKAEIELTSVSKDDAGNMVPKLASIEAYKQANVVYNSSLNSLNFSIEERGARRFILVTSVQSVNEPFLEVLIELNSSSGRLVREYTVLLDPAEMQASNAPLTTAGTAVTTQPAVTTTPLAPTEQPTAGTTPAKTSSSTITAPTSQASQANGTTYQIKSGDTLSKIANQFKPQGVSLEQMLVALQHSNASAFIDNNMNLLRSGRILTIPDSTEIDRTTQSEAKKIVLAQSNDFNTYRNKFASQVEQSKPEKAVEPKKSDSGKITAKVIEAPTAVSESKDKLKLSKAQQQDEANKKALEEDKIAKQRAIDAANARVKELEANTAKLQSILDLKKAAAASAAARAAQAAQAPVAAPVAASAAASSSIPAVAANVAPPPTPVAKPRPKVVAPPPPPEPGLVDNLMKYLPYGAGVLAILGLVGVLASKRKKKSDNFDDESILTGSSIKTNSLFGSTGGQSVDTNNSVFNSNFAPSASQLDANEVDPVAEADVYIAYGRDEQAEEILKEALRTQPDRQAVRVKLLEIYAHRKDTRTFETVASELYGMTGGEGPDWAQAASLGLIIDPQNPLYAGGQKAEHTGALGASTLPVESLDPEALLGNSLSQEMLDSISAKNEPSMMMGEINERTHRTPDADDGLDFDLGLSTNPNADDDFGAAPVVSAAKAPAMSDDIPMHDLTNEVQIPGHSASVVAAAAAPAAAPSAPVHQAAAKLAGEEAGMDFASLDFDFDIPKSHTEEPGHAQGHDHREELASLDTTHIDTLKPAGLDYDLSSIDLNLPKAEAHSVSPLEAAAGAAHSGNSMEFSAPKVAEVQQEAHNELAEVEFSAEMATKLDLAVAYQEIGDKDGARELLEEVLKGGNQEQIARAKTMMHELA